MIDVRVEALLDPEDGSEPKTRRVDRYAHLARTEAERVLGQHLGPTFTLVERKRVESILEELNFQQSGLASPETRSRLGELSGAGVICTGTITSLDTNTSTHTAYGQTTTKHTGSARLNIRFIDVETGEIIGLGGYDGIVEQPQLAGETRDRTRLELPAIADAFLDFEADNTLFSKIIPDAVRINIDTEPTNAHVLIADQQVGTTPIERTAALGEVIRISLQKDGFERFEREFTLDDDLTLLQPLTPIEDDQ